MEGEFLSWLHSNYKKSKKSTRVFITVGIFFIAVALLCLFSFIFLRVQDYNVAYKETTISKFKICSVDNPIENGDASCGNSFHVGIPELFACGYLNASYVKSGNFDAFGMYLYNDKVERPIYESSLKEKFVNGNFCRKLIFPSNSQPGSYHVEVYFYRKLLASSQFELK